MQVIGLKLWIEISYMGAGNLCVVYETSVGTPIFSYFLNKFSYFFLFVLPRNSYFPILLSNHAAWHPAIVFLVYFNLFVIHNNYVLLCINKLFINMHWNVNILNTFIEEGKDEFS